MIRGNELWDMSVTGDMEEISMKGINFDDKTIEEIQEAEDWINNYPREMFGWRTAAEVFQDELDKLTA